MKKVKDMWLKFAALVVIGACVIIAEGIEGVESAEAKMPVVKIKDHIVKLEVATTDQEIQHGLMGRTSLPEDQGMVFLFRPPRPVNFWMYNCFISLDMLFVKDGKIIRVFENVPPCKSKNPHECPLYPPGEGINVSEVIEVKGGWAKAHDVHEGDAVQFDMAK